MLRHVLWCAISALLLFGVVGLSTPAHAGGVSSATIDGPGLAEPIHLDGMDQSDAQQVYRLMRWSGAAEALYEQDKSAFRPDGPSGDRLGPMYTLTFVTCVGRIDQVLYPFADGGPMTYTLGGRTDLSIPAEALRSGWYAASDRLRKAIVEYGATPDGTSGLEQPTQPNEPNRPETPATITGWLIPLGLVGVGGVTLLRRRVVKNRG